MAAGRGAWMRHVSPHRCDNYVRFPVYYSSARLKTPDDSKHNNVARRGIVTMKKRRILLVEDEQDIAELVSLHLRDVCDEFIVAVDGFEGMRLATSETWSLVILDLCLPGPDGLEICRAIRRDGACQQGLYQPILMLTSKSAELDRVLGLETGADDYLTKPFSVLELVARVRAIFRRIENLQQSPQPAPDPARIVSAGNLTIDPTRREVTLRDRQIDLTAREFDLLDYFARNPGRVFRRADLLDKVWGYGHEGYEHTVNSHINRLRAKIEDNPSKPELIVTVWGVGYKFSSRAPIDVAV
jgi:DNA-binding response OmpR family regulator